MTTHELLTPIETIRHVLEWYKDHANLLYQHRQDPDRYADPTKTLANDRGMRASMALEELAAFLPTASEPRPAANEPGPASNDRLLEKLDDLLTHLKRTAIPVNAAMWTTQDIATWLKLSLSSVETRVTNRPEFPAPLQPCLTGQRATKRWFAGDVIKWARQNRHHLPASRARRAPQSSRAATSDAVAL